MPAVLMRAAQAALCTVRGYVIRKTLQKIGCGLCTECLTKRKAAAGLNVHDYIHQFDCGGLFAHLVHLQSYKHCGENSIFFSTRTIISAGMPDFTMSLQGVRLHNVHCTAHMGSSRCKL